MSRRFKVVSSLIIACVVALGGTGYLLRPRAAVAAIGPSGAYGGAPEYYELSNSPDIITTSNVVPIYYPVKPVANTLVIAVFDPAGSGQISFDGSPAKATTYAFNIPPAKFVFDPPTGYYVFRVTAALTGGFSANNFKAFQYRTSGGIIGYDAAANDNKFAVADVQRCDFGIDLRGCGKYFNYTEFFAPSCNLPGGPTFVDIYDPDNPYPLPNGSGNIYNTQANAFTWDVWDVTAGASTRPVLSGSMANGLRNVSTDAHLNFNYTKGHKYQLRLNGVYSNNVLQFRLPFDSIYYGIACPAPTFANTITLNPPTQTVNVTAAGADVCLMATTSRAGTLAQPGALTVTSPDTATAPVGHFRPISPLANYAPGRFTWTEAKPPLGASTVPPHVYCYHLDNSTPTGTYTFTTSVSPASPAGGSATDTATVVVKNPKIPLLNVAAGDVHAGCGAALGGSIVTNPGSSAAEIVSASGLIGGFNSGVTGISESLSRYTPSVVAPLCLNSTGLATKALAYINAGNGTAWPAGNLDLATLPADGLYVINGNAIIHGVVSHNVTLYVSGSVTVQSSVVINQVPRPRGGLPGLGVITPGDVTFNPSGVNRTDQVDGYYYAGGPTSVINTCNPLAAAACNSILQVNGFLMAHQVKLQRWGLAAATQTTDAENIAISGQLYLNPPPLFGSGDFNNNQPSSGGEQSPRY